MLFKSLLLGAVAALATAQSNPLGFTRVPNPVTVGKEVAITYMTNDDTTPVTILLRRGVSSRQTRRRNPMIAMLTSPRPQTISRLSRLLLILRPVVNSSGHLKATSRTAPTMLSRFSNRETSPTTLDHFKSRAQLAPLPPQLALLVVTALQLQQATLLPSLPPLRSTEAPPSSPPPTQSALAT